MQYLSHFYQILELKITVSLNFPKCCVVAVFALLAVFTAPPCHVKALDSVELKEARNSDKTLESNILNRGELMCTSRTGTTSRTLSRIEIKLLQRNLNFQGQQTYGAAPIPVDGIWGKKTYEAVRQWEKYIHFSKYSTFVLLTKETLQSLGIVC